MALRTIALVAGIAPVAGVSVAYWLGASNAILPSCIPPLDGCTSISAAGRYMPGSLLFRAVMLPQAMLLVFLWYLAARWLRRLPVEGRSESLVLVAGLIGALALILYVTFLGTKQPFYEFMRRFGIYFYFLGTAIAQLTLALAVLRHARSAGAPALLQLGNTMLWLCGLPFVLGVANLAFKAILVDADAMENRTEWLAALLMQGYFVVLYFAWRETGFSVDVRVRQT